MIIDTHVHVFTDDRKNYPQIRDTSRAGSIPTVTEIGQTEWPLTTTEMFMYLHVKHANLVEPAARALRAMKADGTYQRIAAQSLPNFQGK